MITLEKKNCNTTLNREVSKISGSWSGKNDKYEYLTG